MSTKPQTVPEPGNSAQDDFITYPLHKVVSIFETEEAMDAAVIDLLEAGVKEEDIQAFCGVEGEERLDLDGSRHGFFASLLRTMQHIGPDRTYLERYEKHLHEDHCMIMVSVRNTEQKERAAQIMHRHTDEVVTYFGLLAASEIK